VQWTAARGRHAIAVAKVPALLLDDGWSPPEDCFFSWNLSRLGEVPSLSNSEDCKRSGPKHVRGHRRGLAAAMGLVAEIL
jgi:hypothetical protein